MTSIKPRVSLLASENNFFEHFIFNMVEKFNSYTENLVLRKEKKLYLWNQEYGAGPIIVSRAQYHPSKT